MVWELSDRMGKSGGARRAPPSSVLSKWESLKKRADGSGISWAWAGPEDLQATIVSATEAGVALLFSKTSDGGALSLLVLTGGEPIKMYPSDAAELNENLQQIREIAESP